MVLDNITNTSNIVTKDTIYNVTGKYIKKNRIKIANVSITHTLGVGLQAGQSEIQRFVLRVFYTLFYVVTFRLCHEPFVSRPVYRFLDL